MCSMNPVHSITKYFRLAFNSHFTHIKTTCQLDKMKYEFGHNNTVLIRTNKTSDAIESAECKQTS